MPGPPQLLPVLDVGASIDELGERAPTAVIDASRNPEVADLARVHAIEGIGDVRTTAMRVPIDSNELVLLGVSLTSPVSATFAVAFVLPDHDGFLREVADAGRLVFATTDPTSAATERPLWLAVDIESGALRSQLDP